MMTEETKILVGLFLIFIFSISIAIGVGLHDGMACGFIVFPIVFILFLIVCAFIFEL